MRGVRRARRAMRGGLVIGARIVCDAMRCAGCDAICCARAAMHGMRCNALRAGWLHSCGAGDAMLLTEGFLGWLSRFKLIRLRRISLATLPRYGRRVGCLYMYCLPPAGVLHSQNKVINAP